MPGYGGFWRRFWAVLLDGLILLPVSLLGVWLFSGSPYLFVFVSLPITLLGPAYFVVSHALYGRSLGKVALGVYVERLNGGRLTWGDSLVRFSPVIIYGVLGAFAQYLAVQNIPVASWQSATVLERASLMGESRTLLGNSSESLYMLWLVAEVIVLISSRKKRAIHDLFSGTVVLRGRPGDPRPEPAVQAGYAAATQSGGTAPS